MKGEVTGWNLTFEYDGVSRTVPATVPGNVEMDLEREGLIRDLYRGDNIHALRPFEFVTWTYSTTFDAPAPGADQRLELVFEGIDTVAEILLNGETIGRTDNMFIAHRFDITDAVRSKANELVVRISPPAEYARGITRSAITAIWPFRADSLYLRKARHMWGWDICPRAVSAGLWRPVRIETVPATRFTDVYVVTKAITPQCAKVEIDWTFVCPSLDTTGYKVRAVLRDGDREAARAEVDAVASTGLMRLVVSEPRAWWPKGYGAPSLYDLRLELVKGDDVTAAWRKSIGLRTLELERTEESNPPGTGEFCFRVNGEKIFIRGSNWVPADALHGRDADRVIKNLALFDELGCNMVRIWGGGVYEDTMFFDFCDRHGILVWQDFMFACEMPPQEEWFFEKVKREAEAVIKKFRNHASLAVWCGDNENDQMVVRRGLRPSVNRLSREVLLHMVELHDPYRPYLPSSPYLTDNALLEGRARGLRATAPEQHLWGPRDDFKSPFYMNNTAHFIGETGYHGCPSPASIRKFISPDKLWPWQDNDEWLTHATSRFLGSNLFSYRIKLMADQVREYFGFEPDDLETFSLASQIVQAEAKKFFIEHARMGKWRKTGILWWNVIDCWPQFSDAVVDYFYDKKLAYEYIKRASVPFCVMIDEPENWHVSVVAVNDTLAPKEGSVTVRDFESDTTVFERSFSVERNGRTDVGDIRICRGEHRLFLIEWTTDGETYHNHYTQGNAPHSFEAYSRRLSTLRDAQRP